MATLEGTSDTEVKLIVVGDSKVGKTCLIARYQDDIFSTSFVSTVGMDFIVKTDKIDGKNVSVKIWDTAGQEKFRSLVDSFYRKADGVLLAFDISSMESYEGLKVWYGQIQSHAPEGIPVLLVGTKSDLSTKREIDSTLAEKWGKSHNMKYVETSSKYGVNVTTAIHQIARDALEYIAKGGGPNSSEGDEPYFTNDANGGDGCGDGKKSRCCK